MPEIAIVPRPASVERRPGKFALPAELTVSGTGVSSGVLEHLGRILTARGGPHVRVVPSAGAVSLSLGADGLTHPEAYRLTVDPEGIRIAGATEAGLRYGLETAASLLADANEVGAMPIPAMDIEDQPRFSWRGMHLDVGRHFFDRDFVLRFLDLLATHKMNRFHLHLTEDQGWRFPVPSLPLLTEVGGFRNEAGERYGGAYTREDLEAIVAHADGLGIEVVPEIELPGHSLAALAAYPQLSCTGGPFAVETRWGIFDDVYCAGSEAVFEFLGTVLEEVIAIFPGRYVHIGGDECPKTRWQACPRCQQRMRDEGLADESELQSWFIGRIARFLGERDRQLIGWDEILEGGLVPGATVMSWRGTGGGVQAARHGHDVVMCPTTHCYFDFKQCQGDQEPGAHGITPVERVYEFEPVPPDLEPESAARILGGQGNVWTERMITPEDVDYMVLPRLSALAEVLWSPTEGHDFADFRRRLERHLPRLERAGYHYRALD